ncbi:MAG: helix-hairpin-helix domain-containing protein [Bacteroidetes bacterium]|nr:helix-hairpin-helix domain-containing protein [Bacteroidota bacterium]
MKKSTFIKNYLYYSNAEKRGILALSLLIIASFFLPQAYSYFFPQRPGDFLRKLRPDEQVFLHISAEDTADNDGQANEEGYYRNEKWRNRYSTSLSKKYSPQNPKQQFVIELNSADSLDLLSLPGIGPWFSYKILNYRKKLGGYYALKQLLEIKGMDREKLDELKLSMVIDTSLITHILVNTVDFKALLKHPYADFNSVKAFIRFRQQIGHIESLEELRRSGTFPDSTLVKLGPYLSFE